MPGLDSYVKLLLHFDGADGSTTITDSKPAPTKTVSAVGNAQIDTAYKKFGTGSILFDGTGDYLTVPDSTDWYFAAGDFTIDGWVRYNNLLSYEKGICGQYVDANNLWAFALSGSGTYVFSIRSAAAQKALYAFSVGMPVINTWYHLELVRNGTDVFLFVNGTKYTGVITPISTNEVPNLATVLTVGSCGFAAANDFIMNGWIDEFRVSKGIARHITNFTPPTSAYDTTVLLSLSLNDTLTLSDAIVKTIEKSLSDTLNIVDGFSRVVSYNRTFTDVMTLSDAIVKNIGLKKADTMTLSDSILLAATRYLSFSDTMTLSDQISLNVAGKISLSFSDSMTLTDAIVKSFHQQHSDNVTLSDIITRAVQKTLIDSCTLSDDIIPIIKSNVEYIYLDPIDDIELINTTQQYTLWGVEENGTIVDLTTLGSYNSSDPNIASIDSSGLVTTFKKGQVTINAQYQTNIAIVNLYVVENFIEYLTALETILLDWDVILTTIVKWLKP